MPGGIGALAARAAGRAATHAEARLARRFRPGGGPRPFPDLPEGADTLPQIQHLVVLMMENHSFDNYLGTLGRGDGLPADASNPGPDGADVRAFAAAGTAQFPGVPHQSWAASHAQWNDGRNDGFVRDAAERAAAAAPGDRPIDPAVAMSFWDAGQLPFYHSVASRFPVADRWFSSCLGPTFPNRRYLVAGTSHGLTSDRMSRIFDRPPAGTIFDALARHHISWADYHPMPHGWQLVRRALGLHGLRASRAATHHALRLAGRGGRLDEGGAKSTLQFTADAYPIGLLHYLRHVRSIDRFLEDAAAGTLPSVSIVDPDFRSTSEENPQDISQGEAFAAQIIDATLHSPCWPSTMLIWVYDEHGGYYDHVPPPPAVEPDDVLPDGEGPWRFDRLGFRVPAVVLSPYARPDHVSHVVRDHTAILKFIERKWNLPPLTRRDAWADDLLDMIDLESPPAFARPPTLSAPGAES